MTNVIDQDQQHALQQMSSKWMAQVGQLSVNNPRLQTPTDTIDILRLGLLRIGHILACVAEERGIQIEETSHVNNWQRARFIESSIQRSHSASKQLKQQLPTYENCVEVQFLQTDDPERPFRVMMIQSMDPGTWEYIQERQNKIQEQIQKNNDAKKLVDQISQDFSSLSNANSKQRSFFGRLLSSKKNIKFDSREGSEHGSGVSQRSKSFWSFSRKMSGISQSNNSNKSSSRESSQDGENLKQIIRRKSSRLFYQQPKQNDSKVQSEFSVNSDNSNQIVKQKSSRRFFFRSKSSKQNGSKDQSQLSEFSVDSDNLNQINNQKPGSLFFRSKSLSQAQQSDSSQDSNNSKQFVQRKSSRLFFNSKSVDQQSIQNDYEIKQQLQQQQQQTDVGWGDDNSRSIFRHQSSKISSRSNSINQLQAQNKFEVQQHLPESNNLQQQYQQYSLPYKQNLEQLQQQQQYQKKSVVDQDLDQASISSTGYSDKQLKKKGGWKFAFSKLKKSDKNVQDSPKKKPSNWKLLKKSFSLMVYNSKK